MTAIEHHLLKLESFYGFLERSLKGEDFQVFALAGDASNRRYFRVVHGEQSWVLMVWDPFVDDVKYPFISVLNHFAKNGVQVPKVHSKSPEEGLVLLEDLGDLTLERKFWENQTQDPVVAYYRLAIDELIKMHYACTWDKTSDCTAFHVAFDVEKLMWEMNYARKHLLEDFCRVTPTAAEAKTLDTTFLRICTRLDQEPKYIAHRDYHSRNLMIKLGRMRVIDFQDARMGTIQYDLVSLLKDSYVNLNDQVTRTLIDYYLLCRTEMKAPPLSMDEFREIYELQSIQRCFKACGSFTSFYNMRKDTRYLKYISRTLNHVRASLLYFNDDSDFLKILEDHALFDRDYEQP